MLKVICSIGWGLLLFANLARASTGTFEGGLYDARVRYQGDAQLNLDTSENRGELAIQVYRVDGSTLVDKVYKSLDIAAVSKAPGYGSVYGTFEEGDEVIGIFYKTYPNQLSVTGDILVGVDGAAVTIEDLKQIDETNGTRPSHVRFGYGFHLKKVDTDQ